MPARTISPAVPCPATTPPNAFCAATPPPRSSRCRPISRRRASRSRSTTATGRCAPGARWRNGRATAATAAGRNASIRGWRSSTLLAGYIASVSRHSTGTAVDVTLIEPARARGRGVRSVGELRAVHRPGGAARTRQQRRHGDGLRLPRRQQPPAQHRGQRRAAAPARPTDGRDGEARLPALSPRMVALHVRDGGARAAP